jgi:peroxiredoxin
MILNPTRVIGWKAKDFTLQGTDGRIYSLADVRGPKGVLVAFICNHCPYVKASISRIVAEAEVLREIGIGTIAVMPNDTESYPEDSFHNMKTFAAMHGFSFPLRHRHDPGSGAGLWRSMHTRLLWLQRTRRTAIQRPTRCLAHDTAPERSTRFI